MMTFSANTQATTQVLLALAQHKNTPLTTNEISTLCGLIRNRVAGILKQFHQAGLVKKTYKGYVLGQHPRYITFLCITRIAEQGTDFCECEGKTEENCKVAGNCPTKRIRNLAQAMLDSALDSISLYDICGKVKGECLYPYSQIKKSYECKEN